ncbi:unnamed protein product [Fusarium graminearum]|uniref:Uncharacterized protein n=1 Tax=Gibberella zeae TaxID=5518 RepID=A0A9N8RGS7_GIBZA|nr:unnamed protein product [Fusarium graminearum]CAF3454694.1 unnamed protein product [Fusarium graminearum]CAG1964975.1 unnamed protein product [Fusarium graminearum]CAG1991569.1 unnamed protein product [Fusarium graminearum]
MFSLARRLLFLLPSQLLFLLATQEHLRDMLHNRIRVTKAQESKQAKESPPESDSTDRPF